MLDALGLSLLWVLSRQFIGGVVVLGTVFVMLRRRRAEGSLPQLEDWLKVAGGVTSFSVGLVAFAAFVMTTPPAVCSRFVHVKGCAETVEGLQSGQLQTLGVLITVATVALGLKAIEAGAKPAMRH